MNIDKVVRSRQRNIATPKDTASHNEVERVADGSVRTAHASVVEALPPVQERTRVLREPFSFRAPEVVFERLITARGLDLFPYEPAERDLISVCCNLPDSHGVAVLLGSPRVFQGCSAGGLMQFECQQAGREDARFRTNGPVQCLDPVAKTGEGSGGAGEHGRQNGPGAWEKVVLLPVHDLDSPVFPTLFSQCFVG